MKLQTLRVMRARMGWTRQDLAKRVGVSARTIAGLEAGTTLPSIQTLILLRKALGDRTILSMLDELGDLADKPTKKGRPKAADTRQA